MSEVKEGAMPGSSEASRRPEGVLTEQEKRLLKKLLEVGAASPVELAVHTFSLPEEIDEALRSLRDKGLVDVRQVPERLGGDLITVSRRGLRLAKGM